MKKLISLFLLIILVVSLSVFSSLDNKYKNISEIRDNNKQLLIYKKIEIENIKNDIKDINEDIESHKDLTEFEHLNEIWIHQNDKLKRYLD